MIFILFFVIQIIYGYDAGIVNLTADNYDSIITQQKNVFVVFSAPWCGHCKTLYPELVKASSRIKYKKIEAVIGILDVSVHPKFGEHRLQLESEINHGLFGNYIFGYPTMLLYRSYGVFAGEYQGERRSRDIISFLESKLSTEKVFLLESARELHSLLANISTAADPVLSIIDKLWNEDTTHQAIGYEDEMLTLAIGVFTPRVDGQRSLAELTYLNIAHSYSSGAYFAITHSWDMMNYFGVSEDSIILIGSSEERHFRVLNRFQFDKVAANYTVDFQMKETMISDTSTESLSNVDPMLVDGISNLMSNLLIQQDLVFYKALESNITQLLNDYAMPLVLPLMATNLGLVHSSPIKIHVLLFMEDRAVKKLGAYLLQLAAKYRGKVLFIQIPSSDYQILDYFSISLNDYAKVVIVDMRQDGQYARYEVSSEDLTFQAVQDLLRQWGEADELDVSEGSTDTTEEEAQSLEKMINEYIAVIEFHIESFFEGTLRSTLFSETEPIFGVDDEGFAIDSYYMARLFPDALNSVEDVPFSAYPGSPLEIVGSQFDDRIMSTDADVFLYVYVPWCGYCKAFEGVLLELVKHFNRVYAQHKGKIDSKLVRNTVIAKMDGSGNEIYHPEVLVSGYPTFYYFPVGIRNKKHPIEYDGERDFMTIVEFLDQHFSYFLRLELEEEQKRLSGLNSADAVDSLAEQLKSLPTSLPSYRNLHKRADESLRMQEAEVDPPKSSRAHHLKKKKKKSEP